MEDVQERNQTQPGGALISAVEYARRRDISRQAAAKACAEGRLPGAVQLRGEDGRLRWMVPATTGEAVIVEAAGESAGPTTKIHEDLRRTVLALRVRDERLAAGLMALAERRLALLARWEASPGKTDATTLKELGAAWSAADPRLVAEWPSLADPVPLSSLYRMAAAVAEGRGSAVLGRIRPNLGARKSRRLGETESRVRQILAALVFRVASDAPVTQVHYYLGLQLEREGLPVPAERWTRREVDALRSDPNFLVLQQKGERGLKAAGPYIAQDKTTILPGAQYVVDNRQFDVEVIGMNGQVVRPWITSIVDHRTICPMGWVILESAATGDSVLAALAAAMLPYPATELNAAAGPALAKLCGVPDDCWIFDNGKDFCTKQIEGFRESVTGLLVGAAEAAGAPLNEEYICGLMAETGARVRRSLPYNARAKIVERSFRDVSYSFDKFAPGYVGDMAGRCEARTNEMRAKFARAAKAYSLTDRMDQEVRRRLAEASGYLLLEDFMAMYEAHVWRWASREDSNAQGLRYAGRTWSPLALFNELAPVRRLPSRETIARLSMAGAFRSVDRGTLRVDGRLYAAQELNAYNGKRVFVRFSRQDRETILVEQVLGEVPFTAPLRVPEVRLVSVTATRSELDTAQDALGQARRDERARVRDLAPKDDFAEPLQALLTSVQRRADETGRGQIAAMNGQHVVHVLSTKDEPRDVGRLRQRSADESRYEDLFLAEEG